MGCRIRPDGRGHRSADRPVRSSYFTQSSGGLLTQLLTTVLAAGLSERAASFVVSGLAGMLSSQALAMLTFAIGRRLWVAIGVPPLVLVSGITMHDASIP